VGLYENIRPRTGTSVIIETRDGIQIDTERDLTAPERHLLQKLLLWRSMAQSLDQFREKKERALLKGWNGSGPVPESPNLMKILSKLEEEVIVRLSGGNGVDP
jgi:hypothetical protein